MAELGYLPMPAGFRYREIYARGKPRHSRNDSFRLRHPSMDPGKRAKIFAPFDALAGFSDALAAVDAAQETWTKGGETMLFWKEEKKTAPRKTYDKETRKPAIRVSICSGEKVAGFQEINSGKFHEIQLIRTDADLEEFLETYGLKKEEVATIY